MLPAAHVQGNMQLEVVDKYTTKNQMLDKWV